MVLFLNLYLIQKTNRNELMNKKYKNVYTVLNYIEYLPILIYTVTGCVSFDFLVAIPIRITSSAIGLKIYVITAGSKKYKWIIKKKKKNHHKILLVKSKSNSLEVLIFNALMDSNISRDEFVLINNVPKEFDDIKKEIKNSNDKWKFKFHVKQCHCIICSV